jgi:hypothetical protein
VSFASTALRVVSRRVFIFASVYFFIDSVRKLLDTPSYVAGHYLYKSMVQQILPMVNDAPNLKPEYFLPNHQEGEKRDH